MAASSTIAHKNPVGRSGVSAVMAAALCFFLATNASAQRDRDGDPPSRVARIAWAQGNVSLEPGGADSFIAAQVNYPLSAGDRVYADLNSLSEVQTSGLAVRLGSGADLTVTSLTDSEAQFALAQGSIRVRARDLYAPPAYDGSPQQAVVEIDTPNATILVRQPGDLRVDTYPQDGTTIVTVNSGAAEVSGQGFDQTIGGNQSIRLSGYDQVYAEYVGLLPPDQLDQFDAGREQRRERSVGFRNHYVDPEMIGAADLDDYGDWQPAPQYGAVWYPRNVPSGWTPYSVGHWAVVPPWGYTWVDSEPWGFAPFHYGRWNNFGGRWGWVPGPPPTVFAGAEFGGHPPRPVYSPALVAFVGGPGFSLSLSLGGGGREGGREGGGVTAWFPLGPSEPYVPWYHTSPAYVNRVNVTNIYTTNVTNIHNTYINKTTTVYNVTNVTYVNRNTATVAVAQKDFAAGRSTTQAAPIKLDDNARRQLAQAPVVQHAVPPPPKVIAVAAQAPARAAPPVAARPVVQTKQGFQRAGAPPAATPLKPPTPPPATAATRAALPQPRAVQTIAPAKPAGGVPIVRNPAPAPAAAGNPPAKAPGAAPVVRSPGNPAAAPVVRAPGTPATAPGQPVPRPTAAGTVAAPAKPLAPAAAPAKSVAPAAAPAAPVQRTPPPPVNQARPPQAPPVKPAPATQPEPARPALQPAPNQQPRTQPAAPVRPNPAATPVPARPVNPAPRPAAPAPAPAVKPSAVVPPPAPRTVPAQRPVPPQAQPVKPNPAAQPAPNQHPAPPPSKKTPPPTNDQKPNDQKPSDQKPN